MRDRDAEFNHPVLVQVYDAQCLWGREDQLFFDLAAETPGTRVLDLGCGTGRITLRLAAAGHRVTGVDPAHVSLEAARRKPGAGEVTWVEGTAADLPAAAFDLALMTSHVAQFMTGDAEWADALTALRRSLLPGGKLIFDTRDPAARDWLAWNPVDSRETVVLQDGRGADLWTEVTGLYGELVTFVHHYRIDGEGAELRSVSTLRFRSEETLRGSLELAGFEVIQMFGGWHRQPVGQGDGEFIVVARAMF
ncbi:class I SAM-dependent methyltransferase [Deinococcus radiomollis]|uniref:class I SAM-dependent methyltransferase n=1 Tax=Deinococcus radiomollis TaxID=468916 RepID=UPI003892B5AE